MKLENIQIACDKIGQLNSMRHELSRQELPVNSHWLYSNEILERHRLENIAWLKENIAKVEAEILDL